MIPVVRYRRLAVLAGLVLLVFGALGGWLFHRQVTLHPRFAGLARDNINFKRLQPARRGAILDRTGVLLATSVPVKTVCADPSLVHAHAALLSRTLAPLLELPEADIARALQPRLVTRVVDGTNLVRTSRYAVIKHKVPLERWLQITNAMGRLDFGVDENKLKARQRYALKAVRQRGVFSLDDYQRQYPNGALAAHVVGYVSSGESEKDEGRVFEDKGVAGLELSFNEFLAGTHGWQTRDHLMPARSGLSAVLTLDAGLQHIVETELARVAEKYNAAGACAIVVRPRTGEVLALASWPAYDANDPGRNPAAFRNRAISDMFEPGSTFKMVTIATAIDEGLLTLEQTVNCENGVWPFPGAALHDHHRYGVLTYEQVVAKSSNIGTAKAAVELGTERLYRAITNFGFGRRSLIPLPGEAAGFIRAPKDWSGISISRVPIGQEVSATPLQMIMAAAAVADQGLLRRPRLVDRLVDSEGRTVRVVPPDAPRRVISEATAREMIRGLKAVVSPEGTAANARLDYFTVAGKTGTAEKFVNGTHKSGKYYSSFVGFLPADRAEICILVGLDEPDRRVGHMGSVVAVPAFKAIGERAANYLRLAPDLPADAPAEPLYRPTPEVPAEQIANRPAGRRTPRLAVEQR